MSRCGERISCFLSRSAASDRSATARLQAVAYSWLCPRHTQHTTHPPPLPRHNHFNGRHTRSGGRTRRSRRNRQQWWGRCAIIANAAGSRHDSHSSSSHSSHHSSARNGRRVVAPRRPSHRAPSSARGLGIRKAARLHRRALRDGAAGGRPADCDRLCLLPRGRAAGAGRHRGRGRPAVLGVPLVSVLSGSGGSVAAGEPQTPRWCPHTVSCRLLLHHLRAHAQPPRHDYKIDALTGEKLYQAITWQDGRMTHAGWKRCVCVWGGGGAEQQCRRPAGCTTG
jgi:hypothetical protein